MLGVLGLAVVLLGPAGTAPASAASPEPAAVSASAPSPETHHVPAPAAASASAAAPRPPSAPSPAWASDPAPHPAPGPAAHARAQGAPARATAARQAAATAADGYRYWSFWQQKKNGSWAYATEGPATQRPEDGDTLGFRFAVSEDSGDAPEPRGTVRFDDACADTAEKPGSKRVALRIDYGTTRDAPAGTSGAPPQPRTACARVDTRASAAETLAAVAEPLRYNTDSLLCAIDGYPAKGCGERSSGKSDGDDTSSGGHDDAAADGNSGKDTGDKDTGGMSGGLGLTAGIAGVAVLGAAALWQARRRKR
ncbi:SCO2322 family protein [Streptomyces sp. NRRL S-1868]|uniref:SCO2322 family protein n=1 Tax=Streptomyces sp. NRRL S-1868 TaxID=1463892 RepID=UPI00131AC537|nr:SCO2322 family protein [Streptomyces sp. NRRL S-1868]